MKNALYYASDKAILDALNNHRVNNEQLNGLFTSRGIILSHKTERKKRAEYFSRMNHDYFDHELIASKLSSSSARDRVTAACFFDEGIDLDDIEIVLNEKVKELNSTDDEATLTKVGQSFKIDLNYTTFDTNKSELSQATQRSAEIFIEPSNGGFIIRSPENDDINSIRESILDLMSKRSSSKGLEVKKVELSAVEDPQKVTEFFRHLIDGLSGMSMKTVTEVFVFNGHECPDEEENFIQKVALKGKGLSNSIELKDLTKGSFYIVKIVWECVGSDPESGIYTIEAQFKDPANRTRFAYQVRSVRKYKGEGQYNIVGEKPLQTENLKILRLIEDSANASLNRISGVSDEQNKAG